MENLNFSGPDSTYLEKDEIEFLGKLLGAILYNEIGIASNALSKVHPDIVIDISQAARTLNTLADLYYNNRNS